MSFQKRLLSTALYLGLNLFAYRSHFARWLRERKQLKNNLRRYQSSTSAHLVAEWKPVRSDLLLFKQDKFSTLLHICLPLIVIKVWRSQKWWLLSITVTYLLFIKCKIMLTLISFMRFTIAGSYLYYEHIIDTCELPTINDVKSSN